MKVKVIEPFLDKYNPAIGYNIGDEIDVEEERGRNLLSRGLCVAMVEENNASVIKKGRPKKTLTE